MVTDCMPFEKNIALRVKRAEVCSCLSLHCEQKVLLEYRDFYDISNFSLYAPASETCKVDLTQVLFGQHFVGGKKGRMQSCYM